MGQMTSPLRKNFHNFLCLHLSDLSLFTKEAALQINAMINGKSSKFLCRITKNILNTIRNNCVCIWICGFLVFLCFWFEKILQDMNVWTCFLFLTFTFRQNLECSGPFMVLLYTSGWNITSASHANVSRLFTKFYLFRRMNAWFFDTPIKVAIDILAGNIWTLQQLIFIY